MAEINTNLDPDFHGKSGIDVYEHLDQIMGEALTDGVVAPHPRNEHENLETGFNQSRIKAARTRLFLLGYLDEDNDSPTQDAAFRTAVRTFQTEAVLEVDGLVGPESWTALAELVGFEDDTNVMRWLGDPRRAGVLEKALRLRLRVLGMLPDGKIDQGIKIFVAVYNAYFSFGSDLTAGMNRKTLEAIFDQEALLARIARCEEEVLEQDRVRLILICVAKIELWLLGYPVVPDGREVFDEPLKMATEHFWVDLGLPKGDARKRREQLDKVFFSRLNLADEHEARAAEKLIGEIEQKPERAKGVFRQLKRLGNRLWDGLKRAARWAGRLFRTGLRKIRSWARSTARALFGIASKAFDFVRDCLKALKYSLEIVIRKKVPGSSPPDLILERDRDFDFVAFVDREADREVVAKGMHHFDTAMTLLGVSSRVVSMIVTLLRKALGLLTGFVGWFRFMFSLAKLWPRLKQFGADLAESRRLFSELEAFEEVG